MCPKNSGPDGKSRSLPFLNAPNVDNFLCKEPGLENKNRQGSEGSGR